MDSQKVFPSGLELSSYASASHTCAEVRGQLCGLRVSSPTFMWFQWSPALRASALTWSHLMGSETNNLNKNCSLWTRWPSIANIAADTR